jgi:NitT/TauT family transport system permease protein
MRTAESRTASEAGRGVKSPVRRPGQWMSRQILVVRAWQVALGLGLLGLWQLVASEQLVAPVLAKSPAESWDYVVAAAKSGELWTNTRATMSAVLIAWVLAGAAGVACGLALGLLPRVERVVNPFFDAANAMPRIALAPLFIVAFGINTLAKVALAVTVVFFVVFSGSRAGVRSTDAEWLRLSVVFGAKKRQLFWKIFLPVAAPAIFAALRLGLIYSLLAVVASELIAARDGLGQLIAYYSNSFNMAAVYAILLLLALVAVLLNEGMAFVERRLVRWQPPTDK